MAKLKVPTISIVIGEGSSGGALALGVTDVIIMLENAVYSILSQKDLQVFYIKIQAKPQKRQIK